MSKLHLFLVTYLGLYTLALPVLAHSGIWLWLVSISDEGSLPEIALSDASKLASTYFSLFYMSVHELYTEIKICHQLERQNAWTVDHSMNMIMVAKMHPRTTSRTVMRFSMELLGRPLTQKDEATDVLPVVHQATRSNWNVQYFVSFCVHGYGMSLQQMGTVSSEIQILNLSSVASHRACSFAQHVHQ